MKKYIGTCHCGAISFSFEHENIESGLRCNCSICNRRGTVMSDFTISPNDFTYTVGNDNLGKYQFDTNIAKHYFCKNCGIYPFHETMVKPGHFRINLGCIEEIDTNAISVRIHDGKNN